MNEPIYMLNALWLKKDGGLEKYKQYAAAARPLLAIAGAEVGESFKPEEALIGDWDADAFFVVKYPSRAVFEEMVNSPDYQAILPLREQALEKILLIRCKAFVWT